MPVSSYGWQIHLPKDLSRPNFIACSRNHFLTQMMWSLLDGHKARYLSQNISILKKYETFIGGSMIPATSKM